MVEDRDILRGLSMCRVGTGGSLSSLSGLSGFTCPALDRPNSPEKSERPGPRQNATRSGRDSRNFTFDPFDSKDSNPPCNCHLPSPAQATHFSIEFVRREFRVTSRQGVELTFR